MNDYIETDGGHLYESAKMSKPKNRFFPAISFIVGFFIALTILEISIRIFVPNNMWQFRDATSDWQLDALLGWVQKPNLSVTTMTEYGWSVKFETNEDGLTPSTVKRQRKTDKMRIMIFGDSTVVGRSAPQNKTINAQLELFLKKRGMDVEVINAGVQGFSTDQALLRLEKLLPLYKPDIVLHAVCTNDFGGIVSDRVFNISKPKFILNSIGKLKLLKPIHQAKEIKMIGQGTLKWIQFSALYRILQPKIIKLRAWFGNWEERNLMGLSQDIYYDPEALARIDWKLFKALIKRMQKISEDYGAAFYFYSHPDLSEVWDPFINIIKQKAAIDGDSYDRYAIENRLSKIAGTAGINFIPLIDFFLSNKSKGPFHLLPRDPHCNPVGYTLTAQVLTNRIARDILTNDKDGIAANWKFAQP